MTHGSSISFGTSYIRIACERKERKIERKKKKENNHWTSFLWSAEFRITLRIPNLIRDFMIRDGNEGSR